MDKENFNFKVAIHIATKVNYYWVNTCVSYVSAICLLGSNIKKLYIILHITLYIILY